jgi:hypothetical protein
MSCSAKPGPPSLRYVAILSTLEGASAVTGRYMVYLRMLVLVIAVLPNDTLVWMQRVAGILTEQGAISDSGFGRWSRVGVEGLDSVENFIRSLVVEERIIGMLRKIELVSAFFNLCLRLHQLPLESCGGLLSLSPLLFLLLCSLLFSRYFVLPFLLVSFYLVLFLLLSFGISRRLSCPTTSGRRWFSCPAGYLIVSIPLPSFHVKEGRYRDQAEEYGEGKAWPIVDVFVQKYLSGHCYILVCGMFVALIMSVDG